MSHVARQAELLKLARVLDTEPETLTFLADQDTATLRVLREGITEALFEKFRPGFAGFAHTASLVPLALSARISQRVLGPTLSGRIAGEMKPKIAIALAKRLPDDFLADTCLQMDPERARAVVRGFPVTNAVNVTRLLVARGEYITMGRFVDVLPEATLLATADAIDDPADLLRIALFADNVSQLDRAVAHLGAARCQAMIAGAVDNRLWPQLIDALTRLTEPDDLWVMFESELGRLDADRTAGLLQFAADEQPEFLIELAARIRPELAATLKTTAARLDEPARAAAAAFGDPKGFSNKLA